MKSCGAEEDRPSLRDWSSPLLDEVTWPRKLAGRQERGILRSFGAWNDLEMARLCVPVHQMVTDYTAEGASVIGAGGW